MNSKTITRPQALALRNAEELPEELLRPTDALRGHLVISARTNTVASLVRLGLAEEVEGLPVLTRAGYTVRAITDLPHYLPRLDTVASIVAAAAEEDALAAEEPTRPDDATYYPNEEGAANLRAACPMYRDGRRVSAIVENGGRDLYVFLGTETIYDGDMPAFVKTSGDVHAFVRQYVTGYVWAAEYRTLWSYRNHSGHVVGPYSDAEFRHTHGSAETYCRGIVDTVGAGEVIRIDRTPEHFDTVGRNWTDVHTVVHAVGRFAAEVCRTCGEPLTNAEGSYFDGTEGGKCGDCADSREDAQEDAPGHGLDVVTVDEVLALLEPVPYVEEPAPVTVWATTESGERINYAHVPNGDPDRVARFLADARAVPHFRNVSTAR